jgi:transcriptional antiterminator RfaH
VAYWTAAQLEPKRERIALHLLARENFTVYAPRLRERRIVRGRREDREAPLFPGYCFVWIELQWHAARWCPGIRRLVMDGLQPARVSDVVIEEIRSRERNGAIELPNLRGFRRGDPVKILHGPFSNHLAIYAGMKPRERVEVLFRLLGGEQRVILARQDIEAISRD